MAPPRQVYGRGSESQVRDTSQETTSKRDHRASQNRTSGSSESDAAESSFSISRSKLWQEPQLPSRYTSGGTGELSSVANPLLVDQSSYPIRQQRGGAQVSPPDNDSDQLPSVSGSEIFEEGGRNPDVTQRSQIVVSHTLKAFIALPLEDYRSCMEFCRRNEAIFDEDTSTLQRMAVESLVKNDSDLSERLVERLAIIKLCEGKSLRKALKYIDCLRYDSAESEDFREKKERMHKAVADHAAKSKVETRSVQLRKDSDRGENFPVQYSGLGSTGGEGRSQSSPQVKPRNAREAIGGTFNKVNRVSRSDGTSVASLNDEYMVQQRANRFFVVGRVFKTLWHTAAGQPEAVPRSKSQFQGLYGERIYSTIRWMIVVKEKEGYCLCCPVSTYAGSGLSMKSFKEYEIRAHAIVFDQRSEPQYIAGEPEFSKRPIAVELENEDDRISVGCRVHFGKVHTVDWTVKVKSVGMVAQEHIRRLTRYFETELMR